MGFMYQHISIEQRAQIGLTAVLFSGAYGLVTQLAREMGTSRKFIYVQAERLRMAVAQSFACRPPGPAPQSHALIIDRRRLNRAIVTLGLVGHAPERAIAACLAELYEVVPSGGYINGVLQQASRAAAEVQAGFALPLSQAQVEADELFAVGKAHLVAVDHPSLLLLDLKQADHCDTPAWAEVWTRLRAQGVDVARIGSDGGKALAGAIAHLPGVEHQLDLWHALRRVGRVERCLEQGAYSAIAREWELEKKVKSMDPKQAMGGYAWQQYAEARDTAEREIQRYEQFHTLAQWLRAALEVIDPGSGDLRTPEKCLAEITVITTLMRTLAGDGVRKVATYLDKAGPGLLQYRNTLARRLEHLAAEMGDEGVRLLCREWRLKRGAKPRGEAEKTVLRRAQQQAHLLALLHWGEGYVQARARVVHVLDDVMRGSSLAECVNSWLRPYADLMKGLGERFLPLFTLYRNSHVFARGKRAGHSPLELAGIDIPEGDWLDWIGLGRQKGKCRSVRSLPQRA